jgi:hypothetical protein
MNKRLIMFAAAAALGLAADPFIGTWKPAHLEKWKLSPGGKGEESKSFAVITEAAGKDVYRSTTTTLDGKPVERRPPFTTPLDGTAHPGHDGATIKSERIDERHFRTTVTSDKGTLVEDFVIDADGKSQTITRKGNGATTGRQVDEIYYFEKASK